MSVWVKEEAYQRLAAHLEPFTGDGEAYQRLQLCMGDGEAAVKYG